MCIKNCEKIFINFNDIPLLWNDETKQVMQKFIITVKIKCKLVRMYINCFLFIYGNLCSTVQDNNFYFICVICALKVDEVFLFIPSLRNIRVYLKIV